MNNNQFNRLRLFCHKNKQFNRLRLFCHNVKNISYSFLSWLGYKYNLEVYDDDFYARNQEEGLKLAEWFVPLLKETFKFSSFIDVGCGTGHYLLYCQKMGVSDVFGIEGSPFAFKHLLVANNLVVKHDLRNVYQFERRWDIAISIEVAEHIDLVDTDNYIRILCDAADVVVITAAPLGQGGTRHINEHSLEWWSNKFSRCGYKYDLASVDKMIAGMKNAGSVGKYVTSWFEPNIMVFRHE
jgi:SAM-dependent methyltransferase